MERKVIVEIDVTSGQVIITNWARPCQSEAPQAFNTPPPYQPRYPAAAETSVRVPTPYPQPPSAAYEQSSYSQPPSAAFNFQVPIPYTQPPSAAYEIPTYSQPPGAAFSVHTPTPYTQSPSVAHNNYVPTSINQAIPLPPFSSIYCPQYTEPFPVHRERRTPSPPP